MIKSRTRRKVTIYDFLKLKNYKPFSEWRTVAKAENFGLIFDTDNSVSPISAITINNYIGKRCNADLSIKLACDATSWPTYCSLNGQIDAIHDYGTVELDDCVKQYTKKMKTIKEGE